MSTAPSLATSLGVAPATASRLGSGHEPDPPGAFAGLRGGPAEPGHGAAFADHDQPGFDEPGAHAGIDLAAVDPAGHDPGADGPVIH
jgi:hypothetical protein